MKKIIFPVVFLIIFIFLGFFILENSPRYGASSTHTIGGDLAVTGNATFGGSVTTTGNFAVTGNLTTSGPISGNVPNISSITMTSATNTACAIQNTSGATRIVLAAGGLFTATPSIGTFSFIAGTSTGPTVTSTSPFVNTSITTSASLDVINATSSFNVLVGVTSSSNAYATWRNNEWFTWNVGTTTVAGTCKAEYY